MRFYVISGTSRTILLAIALLAVVGCDGAGDGDGAGSWSLLPPRPDRPSFDAISDGLVQASGGQHSDGGLIENACVVGEPFAAGTVVAGGVAEVRHGFWLPLVPMAPFGIAWVRFERDTIH